MAWHWKKEVTKVKKVKCSLRLAKNKTTGEWNEYLVCGPFEIEEPIPDHNQRTMLVMLLLQTEQT